MGGANHKVPYPPPSPVVVKVPLFVMYSITPDRGGSHVLKPKSHPLIRILLEIHVLLVVTLAERLQQRSSAILPAATTASASSEVELTRSRPEVNEAILPLYIQRWELIKENK